MASPQTGIANTQADAVATLRRYGATFYKTYPDGRSAYRSRFGWIVVTPQNGGKFKFELHQTSTSKCPCES
jgi:outer membrane lipoprotein-sorting protein